MCSIIINYIGRPIRLTRSDDNYRKIQPRDFRQYIAAVTAAAAAASVIDNVSPAASSHFRSDVYNPLVTPAGFSERSGFFFRFFFFISVVAKRDCVSLFSPVKILNQIHTER